MFMSKENPKVREWVAREFIKKGEGCFAGINVPLDSLGELLEERDRFKKALQDIIEEPVINGNLEPVTKYENPLTAALRNIAVEVLENERY